MRLARSLCGSKSRMKVLKDLDRKVIEEEDRAEGFETTHLLWQDRGAEEEEEVYKKEDVPVLDREELKNKVLDSLYRTANTLVL